MTPLDEPDMYRTTYLGILVKMPLKKFRSVEVRVAARPKNGVNLAPRRIWYNVYTMPKRAAGI